MTTDEPKLDEYRPTANERKLIEAMSDPQNRNKSITALCQVVGISREAYYRMMRKEAFVTYYKRVQFEVIKGSLAKVIAATIDFAVNDSKCHQDRKMILEMGEVYTERVEQKHEHTGEGGGPLQIVFSDKMRPPDTPSG